MRTKIGLCILFLFQSVFSIAQEIPIQKVYEINTQFALSATYSSENKWKCAISILKQLDVNPIVCNNFPFKSRAHAMLAEAYLKIGDTILCEKNYLKFLSENSYRSIIEITQLSSPYNFVYKKNKHLLDSIYLGFNFDVNRQKVLTRNKEILSQMIAMDQFARVNLPEISLPAHRDSIVNSIFIAIDSINTKRLIKLLNEDSSCAVANYEFANLYILNLHLSRYDTSTFIELVRYNNRCFGIGNTLNSIIADNRSYNSWGGQIYQTYLLRSNLNDSIDFKYVDECRMAIGLPSLYFDIRIFKLKLPPYYTEFHTSLLKCAE